MKFIDASGKLKAFWAILLVAVLLLGAATTVAVVNRNNLEKTRSRLEAVYEKSLVDTLFCLDTLETELEKLTVMQSGRMRTLTLYEISRLAQRAQINLTQLPLDHSAVEKSTRFVNMLADYSDFLAKKGEDAPTEEESKNLAALLDSCKNINASLQEVSILFKEGQFDLTAMQPNWREEIGDGAPVNMLSDTSIEYPALIYDGPFSESETLKKPVTKREGVTRAEAAKSLAALSEGLSETGEMGGDLPCYLFGEENKSAMVTKEGGLVLQYNNSREVSESTLSEKQARDKALALLNKLDLGDFVIVWKEEYDNTALYNAAPKVNGAIVYADLIKLKVALDNGEIIGLDARSYIMAHKTREIEKPGLAEEEAKGKVKEGMEIQQSQLALIPIGQKEVLCWEFYGLYEKNKFIIYIDAKTGEERNVLRIITSETGELTA